MTAPAVRFSVQTWGTDVPHLRRFCEAADRLGYHSIAYGDGLGPWTHDGWVILGALATWTGRVRIGPAVTYCFDPSSHHPAWLAKRAVAVDHLSDGRLDLRLGIGAEAPGVAEAWRSLGVRYPTARERVEALEEAVSAIRGLWSGRAVNRAGPRYTLVRASLEPRPVQQPGPPIWVAAMGPRALGVSARVADGWEGSFLTPGDFQARWARLAALLQSAERSTIRFRRSVELDVVLGADDGEVARLAGRFRGARGLGPDHPFLSTTLLGDVAAVTRRVHAYVGAGATDFMLGFSDFPQTTMLERFAEGVLPAFAARDRAVGAP